MAATSLPAEPVPALGLRPQDLAQVMEARGVNVDISEARRVQAHRLSAGHPDLSGMKRPVSKALRAQLEVLDYGRPRVVERVTDPVDQSVRYLFELSDGAQVEAVRIPLQKEGRSSVCLSSQVGCAMRCDFCATGRLGLSRNLSAHEIVGCFLQVRDEAPGRVTGAVFMGQGEPFHNYDAVIRAAQVLADPCGGRIAQEAISISTVGLVPRIQQFADEGHRFRLVVSLTSAVQEKRERLLPVAAKWALEELFDALTQVHASTGKRQTLAWVLMGGVNDGADEVEALQRRIGELPIRLNLIDVNDDRPDGYRRSTDAERNLLLDRLQVLGVPLVRRYSVGASQNSACGMLASRRAKGAIS